MRSNSAKAKKICLGRSNDAQQIEHRLQWLLRKRPERLEHSDHSELIERK